MDKEPKRGDIFYVNKGCAVGSEQSTGRPAVIISNDIGNCYGPVVTVVYLTTRPKKPLPTHVQVAARTASIALCEQVTTVSKDRLGKYVRTCSGVEMAAIESALQTALGIETAETKETAREASEEELRHRYRLEAERDLYKECFEKLAGIV